MPGTLWGTKGAGVLKTRWPAALLVCALLALAGGCGAGTESELLDPGGLGAIEYVPLPRGEGQDAPIPREDIKAVLVRFVIGADTVHVLVTDPGAMDQLLAIDSGPGVFTHFSGLIRPGPGASQENAPWSWYIDGRYVIVNIPHDPVTSVRGSPQFIEANVENLVLRDMHYQITSDTAVLADVIPYGQSGA